MIKTTVYKLYDDDDRLYFIGITDGDVTIRLEQHEALDSWWSLVRKVTMPVFFDRTKAEKFIRDSVTIEDPIYDTSTS